MVGAGGLGSAKPTLFKSQLYLNAQILWPAMPLLEDIIEVFVCVCKGMFPNNAALYIRAKLWRWVIYKIMRPLWGQVKGEIWNEHIPFV